MKLMIVESPNKIKKIQPILGDGWIVKASVGHIRDLPKDELGVDPDNKFRPTYRISEGKSNVVSGLKAAASKASEVWIATDPDREGEAIAWHIKAVLKLNDYKRVTFNEVTKKAINAAIANPRKIDMRMVQAQEARRIIDRLFGYIVSPELSQKSGAALSAGRVQSPTVRLIVDRERAIIGFEPKDHYGASITLDNGLSLKLDTKPWQDDEKLVQDRQLIERVLDGLSQVKITRSECNDKSVNPKPPFTTSELQQVASAKLGISTTDTMKHAQSLFEAGLITYHRTDDPNLSDDAWQMISDHLEGQGIEVSDSRRKWKSKDGSQEAHEAIRPSNLNHEPSGSSDEDRLYRLIYERSLAAVAACAIDAVTSITATGSTAEGEANFSVSGTVQKCAGWRNLITLEKGSDKEEAPKLSAIPALDDVCFVTEKNVIDQVTKAPARFTEATLIKELEKREIGRPSTYASILSNVFGRQYLSFEKGRKIIPTDLGCAVVDALMPFEFLDLSYTADLEKQLDVIADGGVHPGTVIDPAYRQLMSDLPSLVIDAGLLAQHLSENTVECPKCAKPLVKKTKKDNARQYFFVHLNQEDGDQCTSFVECVNGKPYFAELTNHSCPICQGKLKRIFSSNKKKHFWVHDNDAKCGLNVFDDGRGKPLIKDFSPCPKCGKAAKRMESKQNKGNFFWVHVGDKGDCEQFLGDDLFQVHRKAKK